MHRLGTASFWKTGTLVLGAISMVLGYQLATTISAANMVIQNAESALKRTAPSEVYRAWDDCTRGQGDYAGRRFITQSQCQTAAVSVARETVQARKAHRAFSGYNRQLAEGASRVENDVPWPLSVVIDPLYKLVMRSLG